MLLVSSVVAETCYVHYARLGRNPLPIHYSERSNQVTVFNMGFVPSLATQP